LEAVDQRPIEQRADSSRSVAARRELVTGSDKLDIDRISTRGGLESSRFSQIVDQMSIIRLVLNEHPTD
jgi:hypothetical protein